MREMQAGDEKRAHGGDGEAVGGSGDTIRVELTPEEAEVWARLVGAGATLLNLEHPLQADALRQAVERGLESVPQEVIESSGKKVDEVMQRLAALGRDTEWAERAPAFAEEGADGDAE